MFRIRLIFFGVQQAFLPSEKAFAYKMELEAMKRQGQRTDLTSRPMVEKSISSDLLGENTGESGRQIVANGIFYFAIFL